MPWSERITIDPDVLAGKPVVKGRRLSVAFLLELLAAGESIPTILENYPGLAHEDILACLAYASYLVQERQAVPLTA